MYTSYNCINYYFKRDRYAALAIRLKYHDVRYYVSPWPGDRSNH